MTPAKTLWLSSYILNTQSLRFWGVFVILSSSVPLSKPILFITFSNVTPDPQHYICVNGFIFSANVTEIVDAPKK